MAEAAKTPGPSVAAPGPEHEVLTMSVGVWDATVEVRFPPGAMAQASKGVATNRLACGGLWLISEFKNESTGFEGHGVYGYDPARGKYVATWVDPMRTFLATSEGTYDPGARKLTLWTEAMVAPGKTMRWREVTETIDADTQVWRQFMPGPDGSEVEVMTATYHRRR